MIIERLLLMVVLWVETVDLPFLVRAGMVNLMIAILISSRGEAVAVLTVLSG